MRVTLRPAILADRPAIYAWMARSDATAEMMGPPRFPDLPVETFAQFRADWDDACYRDGGPERLHVIEADGRDVGAIGDSIAGDIAELDIWIGSRCDWGKGIGSAALRQRASMLFARGDVTMLVIRPSARNERAVAAYLKAGFAHYDRARHDVQQLLLTCEPDYEDAVILVWPRRRLAAGAPDD